MHLRKLIRKNYLGLVSNGAVSLVGVGLFMLLARRLSLTEFGEYAMLMSAFGLTDMIRTGFIRQGMVRMLTVCKPGERDSITGSAWVLLIVLSVGLALLLALVGNFLLDNSTFFVLPVLLMAAAPHQMTSWLLQSHRRFGFLHLPRLLISSGMVGFAWFTKSPHLEQVLFTLIALHMAVSILFSMFYGQARTIKHASYSVLLELVQFGKYSFGTLAGTSLLKSSDLLLIGWLIGKEAAGIYAVPLKALEVIEIPMRTFMMSMFGKLSQLHYHQSIKQFRSTLFRSIQSLTIIFLPVAIICIAFPSTIVTLLGGHSDEGIAVLQVLALGMLIMPGDKMLGMAFECQGIPKRNATKVGLMVLVNVIGDLVVIQQGGDLWLIGLVTVTNIAIGSLFALFNQPALRPDRNQLNPALPIIDSINPKIES